MKKVTVSLFGGLGNQLFQYAAALSLAKHINAELVLDLSWFEEVKYRTNITTRQFALKPFGLNSELTTARYPILRKVLVKLQALLGVSLTRPSYYYEKSFHFDQAYYATSDSTHLYGYWQSPQYFRGVKEILAKRIGTPSGLDGVNQSMLDLINSTEAVCVHVRRGDFVTNHLAAKIHGVCALDYYQRGVDDLRQRLVNPHAFIFSDEPEWVSTHLKLPIPMTIVDLNGPHEAHFDLWLMAACKHFIIANSSLSWWAAWLGKSNDKVVIAPKKWFVSDDISTDDLIPSEWLRF